MIAEREFRGADGRMMFFRHRPAATAKAVVLIGHGFGEHSGRYLETITRFSDHGITPYVMDLRGFGHNARVMGDMESLTLVAEDIRLLTALARTENPGLPMILLGHSMGGLLALNQLILHQGDYDLCITIAPGLLPPENANRLVMFMCRLLATLTPQLKVSPLEAHSGTRNAEMNAREDEDSLMYTGGFRARTGYQLLRLQHATRERLRDITLPLLGLHGGGDLIMNPSATDILIESVGSKDRTKHIFPGLYHEVMNEPERDSVFDVIFQWLDARISRSG